MFAWARVSEMDRYIKEKRFGANWKSTRGWEYPWVEDMLASLKPASVADCGCGSSPFTVRLAKLGYKVTAIDNFSSTASETNRRFLRKNRKKVDFIDSNLLDIDMEDSTVDCVISISVLEHIADTDLSQRKALSEMCRIVRPGGHIIITNDTFLNTKITEWWNPPEDARWAVQNLGVEFLDPSMSGFKKEDMMHEDDLFVIPPEDYIKHGYGKPLSDGSGAFNVDLYHRLTSLAYVFKKI